MARNEPGRRLLRFPGGIANQKNRPFGYLANQKNRPFGYLMILFVFLWLVSAGVEGWKYFPLLDDWYWFGKPNLVPERWTVFMDNYATRPLGGLFNVQVFSRFWPNLGPVYFYISVLALVSAFIFHHVARREFRLPMWVFFVCLLWWPAAVEGVYWLGAATLIVPAMFFLALAMYFVVKYRDEAGMGRRRLFWIAGFICTLSSFLFYEQYWFCGAFVLLAISLLGRVRFWQSGASVFLAVSATA